MVNTITWDRRVWGRLWFARASVHSHHSPPLRPLTVPTLVLDTSSDVDNASLLEDSSDYH